jgi:hypothetical protein
VDVPTAAISRTPVFPSTVTGLEIHKNSLLIFPNPARNVVEVTLPADVDIQEVQVWDLNGQRVLSHFEIIDEGRYRLDLGSLPPGVYLLQMTSSESIFTGKIFKR